MGVACRLEPMGTGVGVSSLGSFRGWITEAYFSVGKQKESCSAVK